MVSTYSTQFNQLSDILLSVRELPSWAHPEVQYWYTDWRKIRDCIAGERAVKEQGQIYLPGLEGQEPTEYHSFKERATFHNFTARTINALSGSIMRRRPKLQEVPETRKNLLDSFTKDGLPFWNFCAYVASEIPSMGRLGILVDLPDEMTTQPRPYTVAYTAENILDWDVEMFEGRMRLNYVVLREAMRVDPKATDSDSLTARYSTAPRYRVLRLNERGEYIQEIYEQDSGVDQADFTLDPTTLTDTIMPLRRGVPLKFIPFIICGPSMSTANCEKPPIMDIANLNISHYRSYAYLEHGRFFTGFPIYWTESPMTGQEDGADFRIGASTVWMLPPGAKAGLLEMNGQGLKFLTEALDVKEAQAAQIGGRIMGIRGNAASMSDNQLTMQERNEQSVLLQITLAMDDRITQVLRWMLYMSGLDMKTAEKASVEFNKDFLFNNAGARELRAIHMMYQDAAIPVEVLFAYLKRAEVVEDWMEVEDFKKLMADMNEFPLHPDAQAKKEGYPDAKAKQEAEAAEQARKDALDREARDRQNDDAPDDEEDEDDEDGNSA